MEDDYDTFINAGIVRCVASEMNAAMDKDLCLKVKYDFGIEPETFRRWAEMCRRWLDHKDIYSDKFLNQTVEVEVPDILDKAEHDYLEAVIKPWKEKVTGIQKWTSDVNTSKEFIVIEVEGEKMNIMLPCYPAGTMYKGMEAEKWYTLEELGL